MFCLRCFGGLLDQTAEVFEKSDGVRQTTHHERGERPSICNRIGLSLLQHGTDSQATAAKGYSKKAPVGHVPLSVNI